MKDALIQQHNASKSQSSGDQSNIIAKLKQELEEKNALIEKLQKSASSPQGHGNEPKGRKRELTINLKNISVNEKLASTGGSNATVFSCYVDGWQCAMKELPIAYMNAEEIKHFEREIGLLEAMPFNNNIVRYLFHEKDTQKLRLYITKYACSLRDKILERKREVDQHDADGFSVREITRFALDIAKGLSFLHSNNIIHRDLKVKKKLLFLL
jgi:hypothetical protein